MELFQKLSFTKNSAFNLLSRVAAYIPVCGLADKSVTKMSSKELKNVESNIKIESNYFC